MKIVAKASLSLVNQRIMAHLRCVKEGFGLQMGCVRLEGCGWLQMPRGEPPLLARPYFAIPPYDRMIY
jgi:hypothetical protein